MHRRVPPPSGLLRLGATQSGVLSHEQIANTGAPPGVVRAWKRDWHHLGQGLWCIREPEWRSWCIAGLLRGGPASAVGGSAAAFLWGLTTAAPTEIEIWVPDAIAPERLGDGATRVRYRRAIREGVADPRRTDGATTVLDIARRTDWDTVVSLVTRGLALGRFSRGELLDVLGRRKRQRYRKAIKELCRASFHGVESVLEWRFLVDVVRAHLLSEPTRQYEASSTMRCDALWEEFGVVAELDGRVGHSDVFREMSRDNRLAMKGLLGLHYGWDDVDARGCGVARQLGMVLRARGWDGRVSPCYRCDVRSDVESGDAFPAA